MATAALQRVEAAPAPAPAAAAPQRSLLRFITCGSVDDGKSTLIGRILFECGAVFDDHLDALDRESEKFGTTGGDRDFALLVDGLSAEREQGITIDVAYRYFSTPRRSFIVADTPGHEQYTRNMATGASTADVAILLVDARKGLLAQTRRHSFIVSMVGVKHVVVAVNKMDLVDFDEAVFRRIEADYRAAVAGLGFASVACVPVSAREGDNLTTPSLRMRWHRGAPLLSLLESIEVEAPGAGAADFAMPVQWVNRPSADFRGFSGTIALGAVAVGDEVAALPSRRESRVARIVTADGDLPRATAGQAVTIVLADEVDLSRGDVLAAARPRRSRAAVRIRTEIAARLLVTGERRVRAGADFVIRLGAAQANATVVAIDHAVDVETYGKIEARELGLNAIGLTTLRFDRPLVLTDYAEGPSLGGFILIDRRTNETAAFGFVSGDPAPKLVSTRRDARRAVIETLLGPGAAESSRQAWSSASWRLASGAALGVGVFALSGAAPLAFAVAFGDVALRPLARAAHDAIWRTAIARRADDPSLDGGGI